MLCTLTFACGAGMAEVTGDAMSVAIGHRISFLVITLDGWDSGGSVIGVICVVAVVVVVAVVASVVIAVAIAIAITGVVVLILITK